MPLLIAIILQIITNMTISHYTGIEWYYVYLSGYLISVLSSLFTSDDTKAFLITDKLIFASVFSLVWIVIIPLIILDIGRQLYNKIKLM